MTIKFKKLYPDAHIPESAHPGDAGIDLRAYVEHPQGQPPEARVKTIRPGNRALIKTGLSCELPPGTELQIRPRSGLAFKNGITVLNTPGTIDEGYRGEIGVILFNSSPVAFKVMHGMKIAQACLKKVLEFDIEEVDELSETSRGEGGFGSTGI